MDYTSETGAVGLHHCTIIIINTMNLVWELDSFPVPQSIKAKERLQYPARYCLDCEFPLETVH